MAKILMVLSSAATTVTGKDAGYYLPEAAHVGIEALSYLPRSSDPWFTTIQPYYSFVQAGLQVDFASPKGRDPPVSKNSVEVRLSNPPRHDEIHGLITESGDNHESTTSPQQSFKDDESVRFLQDPDVTDKLSNCKSLSDVIPSEYQAVFYVGGKVFDSPGLV